MLEPVVEVELNDVIDKIIDHRGKTPKKLGSDWLASGIPAISAKNVRGGKLVATDAIRYVDELTYTRWMNGQDVLPGDCLLVSEGATLGESMYWSQNSPVVLSQRLFAIRPNPNRLDPKFLAVYMRGEAFQKEIDGRSTGSSVPGIRQSELRKVRLKLPDIGVQRDIGVLFHALETKISLNHELNKTLENIARAVFKSWFIDFDPVHAKANSEPTGLPPEIDACFPDSFDADSRQVPSGWAVKPLGTLVDVERGLSYKGKHVVDEGHPMLNLGCFGLNATLRQEKLKHYDGEFKDRHVVKQGDVLVANTDMTQDRAILGTPLIVPEHLDGCLFTHHVYALRPRSKTSAGKMLWLRFALLQPAFRFEAEGRATGTTVLFMPKDAIEDFSMPSPPEAIVDAFSSMIGPLLQRQSINLQQAKSLAELRDLLLPRLVSGEFKLPTEVPA
jgi:type I restriction enzyme S subunit